MLAPRASDETLVRAAAANQTTWMARTAQAAGGVVHRERGVTLMTSIAGAVLAFPRLSRKRFDEILMRFLAAADGTAEASCWSLLPTQPPELGERLLAEGFREGWQARWMAAEIQPQRRPEPHGVAIGLVDAPWPVTELPWDGAGVASVRVQLANARPRRVWHFGAWRDVEPVGHTVLNVTTGRLGVAGIYDMGVAAAERRRGIGSALTLAALEHAYALAARVATLNATPDGELLYRTLGFRAVGVAQTWWR